MSIKQQEKPLTSSGGMAVTPYWKNTPSGYLPQRNTTKHYVNRNNQRLGVAVADSPNGPWKRFDKPLIDAQPGRRTAGVCVLNQRHDGLFQIMYKYVTEAPGRRGGPVVHVTATGEDPLGPFKESPLPFIQNPRTNHPIDDHVHWYQDGRYYCIGKHRGDEFLELSKYGKSLILFESDDGFDWELSKEHPLVHEFKIHWEDGEVQHFQRLELQKIYLEDGKAKALFLAALPVGTEDSFGVAIELHP